MTTRYQKRHYEDVARLFANRVNIEPLTGHYRPIIQDFADLFAADNPPMCSWPPGKHPGTCDMQAGFDRERFLAACGLDCEGDEDRPWP